MAEWITPVTDRTQEDVEFAITKIAEWIAGNITHNPLVVYDLKGCLNVSDINRIENNIEYLSKNLTKMGYTPSVVSKSWEMSGIPNERDIFRILANVRAIISAFYQQDSAPNVPSTILRYEDANDIEKNLELIKELLDCMVSSFRKSNTFKAGSRTFLPMRR